MAGEQSGWFHALNRNKRSLALDLRRPGGTGHAAPPGAPLRRRAGIVSPGRDGAARRGIRGALARERRAGSLLHLRVRAGRPVPRPGRARHRLRGAGGRAGAERAARSPRSTRGAGGRRGRRLLAGGGRDPGRARRARGHGQGRLGGRGHGRGGARHDGPAAGGGRRGGARAAPRRRAAERWLGLLRGLPGQGRRVRGPGGARAQVLPGLLRGGGAPRSRRRPVRPGRRRAARRDRGHLRLPHPRRVGRLRGPSRRLRHARARGGRAAPRPAVPPPGQLRRGADSLGGEGHAGPGLPGPDPRGGGAPAPAPRMGADSEEVLAGSGFDAAEVAALRASGALG